jgi:hypothetical protein
VAQAPGSYCQASAVRTAIFPLTGGVAAGQQITPARSPGSSDTPAWPVFEISRAMPGRPATVTGNVPPAV